MLAIWLCLAFAQDAPITIPGEGAPFHDVLTSAKQALWSADHATAEQLLAQLHQRLEQGEDPGEKLAIEALVFLADVRLTTGDKESARALFREVLLRDPDHILSPYDHGEDVRAMFALVKEQINRERAVQTVPPLPVRPIAPPLWVYAPLGVPQWLQGRGPEARTHAVLQAAFGATSIISFVLIDHYNRPPGDRPHLPRERVVALRYGLQWPATVAFYVSWGWSVLDARRHHKRQPSLHARLGPRGLQIGSRF